MVDPFRELIRTWATDEDLSATQIHRRLVNEHGYRGEVISAMIDADYELKIGETLIKAKGELLSLTATEAAKHYGAPPQPLLSAGTDANGSFRRSLIRPCV